MSCGDKLVVSDVIDGAVDGCCDVHFCAECACDVWDVGLLELVAEVVSYFLSFGESGTVSVVDTASFLVSAI